MLDNCKIHKTEAIKALFKKHEVDLIFNAAYSP